MQTIEEYKEYTKQLEGEVKRWHDAYDALVIERNALVSKLLQYEKTVEVSAEDGSKCVALSRKTYDAIVSELNELRKHEVEWDLAQARIKELETENKSAKDDEIDTLYQKSLARIPGTLARDRPTEIT